MKEQIEKLNLHSHDIVEDKRQELLRLFPEIRTEGGKLDFERLKLAVGESPTLIWNLCKEYWDESR